MSKLAPEMKALAIEAHAAICNGVDVDRLTRAHGKVGCAETTVESQLCLSVYTLLEYPDSDEARACLSAALDLFDTKFTVHYPNTERRP